MKSRRTDRDYSISIEELKEIVKRNDTYESILFQEFLEDLILQKKSVHTTINKIATTSGISRNDLTRFPVLRHKCLSAVAQSYELSLEEANALYRRSGLCLSLQNDYDREYIKNITHTEDDLVTYGINQESYINCLLRLIKEHNYDFYSVFGIHMNNYKKKYLNKIKDFSSIDDTQKFNLLNPLFSILQHRASSNNWILVGSRDFKGAKSHKREVVFEISYVCDFDLNETENLFNAFGFSLCPDYIKFDAYVVWLIKEHPQTNDFFYLYKEVCSDIRNSFDGNFQRIDPEISNIDKVLDIKTYSKREVEELLNQDRLL